MTRCVIVIAFLVGICGCSIDVRAQSNQATLDKVLLPQILPATPEVTAFMKVGFGNATLSTGAATAQIPLYTLKLNDFAFPISLSYATQGLKADEQSSRTGMGWTLNANGVVARSVKGMPDEFGTRLAPPAGFPNDDSVNIPLFGYFSQATESSPSIDTQADEFQFHVNGETGTFLLNDSYLPVPTTTTNAKITVNISNGSGGQIGTIIIRTADGVKYTFGNTFEKTTSTNMAQFDPYKVSTKTAFFLDRIDLPQGDFIDFIYQPVSYTVTTGTNQTLIATQPAGNTYSTQQNNVGYNTNYLQSIQASNGIDIDFTYAGSDESMRLAGMEVEHENTILKSYLFEYSVISSSPHPRSYLTKLRDVTGEELYHLFTYDRLSNVPPPITLAQDYLGFYNGGNESDLIPHTLEYDDTFTASSYKQPNFDAAKLGTLASILYPTGGTEEFFYEANTESRPVLRSGQFATVTLEGPGGGSGGSYEPKPYWQHNIGVPFTQEVTLSCWASDASADESPDAVHRNVSVWIYDETNPNNLLQVASRASLGLDNLSTIPVTLYSGHTYALKMVAEHYTEVSHATIDYKLYPNPIYDDLNVVVPGVRVKEIRYTDPYTGSTHSKYYTYASLNDRDRSTGSSNEPVFTSSALLKSYSDTGTSQTFARTIFSTNTAKQVFSIYSSPIYYNKVIESDDPCMQNGGTEYTFYPVDQGSDIEALKGPLIPAGGGQYPTLTGVVKTKRVFDSELNIVQTEEDIYETLIDISGMPASYDIRKNFPPAWEDANTGAAFDVTRIHYGNYWHRLKTKKITSYADGGSFIRQTNYFYEEGDGANVQPDSLVVNDSKDGTWSTSMQYASSQPNFNQPGYSNLVTQNRVATPVYKAVYHNSALQQVQKTLYKAWFTNVIEPEKIQVRESAEDVLHDAIIYLDYDNTGHPKHLKKAYDFEIVYLWDAELDVAIAEVKNALPGQVAFTSFENNTYGNWSLSGAPSTANKFTGTKSFTGTLTATVAASGKYIVSLWSAGGAPTVNGITPPAPLATSNSWSLYQVTLQLSNGATVTVNTNSSYVDEVRLVPEGGEMKSFTHNPFIGVTSQSDANQRVSFYEYDSSNRLSLIRDQNYNIVKTFDYHYQQEP